ncbi:MAG: GMC family oxidoreductase N-terminal domain-containing protein [Myxococcota bacterium]
MIRAGDGVTGGFTLRTDVCVIGSGAGGGVAAAVLAEAGREVVVLEEGAHVPGERMTQREHEMYPLLYRDGGQQYTDDGGVSVLQGRCVGGSTVINMADCVPIPEPVLAHWAQRFGVRRWGYAEVDAAAREVMEVVGANPIAFHNRNNQLLLDGAAKTGLAGGAFVHNRVDCRGSGYCLIGCRYDAKRSVAVTWIPRAVATGRVLVQADARVESLEWQGRRVVAAVGHVVERGTARPLGAFRVEADRFVLAAGAIHTPLLLLASGLGGEHVGRNLTLQPQAIVAATFPDEVVLFRGVPQSAYAHADEVTAEGGLGGFRLEAVGAAPAMAASSATLWGKELATWMARYRHTAACLCLVPDRPGGRVTRGRDGRPRITYAFQDTWTAQLKRAVRAAAEAYLAAGADGVSMPFVGAPPVRKAEDIRVPDDVRPGDLSLISAHPQGTCRIGEVVGDDLRVVGMDNAFVLDASVFPTSASTHTMIPVMSFALLGARALSG